MPIRDDSAGSYGQWDDSDLSWLDYLKATGSDIGSGTYNALANLTGALSPIGTSPEGNMAFQVPPMVSGIADSYARLAGTPSQPGNAYDLSGVPELDAPIQADMSNVLLSLYGGNAVAGLSKPKGALGAGSHVGRADMPNPIRLYHGTNAMASFDKLRSRGGPESVFGDAVYATPHPGLANHYAGTMDGSFDNSRIFPLDVDGPFVTPEEFYDIYAAKGGSVAKAKKEILAQGYNGVFDDGPRGVAVYRPGTVRSATTGETLFSDTGKPSLLGSALATGGEQKIGPLDYAKAAYKHLRYPTEAVDPSEMLAWNNLIDMQQRVRRGEQQIAAESHWIDKNREYIKALENDQPGPFNDGDVPVDPYEAAAFNQQIRQRKIDDGTLFSRGFPLPPQQQDDTPSWLRF